MIPYALSILPQDDVKLFLKIEKVYKNMPDDIDLGVDEDGEKILLSCHILVKAVAEIFCLKYASGFFRPNFSHSWIVTAKGNIIDVYPIANILGGPFLIRKEPYSDLYEECVEGDHFPHDSFDAPSFKRSVKIVVEIIKKMNI